MADTNAEMNTVAEEILDNVDPMAVVGNDKYRTFDIRNPKDALYTVGLGALGALAVEGAKFLAKKTIKVGGKVVNNIKEKHNAKKAAKAKVVEGTATTVDETPAE